MGLWLFDFLFSGTLPKSGVLFMVLLNAFFCQIHIFPKMGRKALRAQTSGIARGFGYVTSNLQFSDWLKDQLGVSRLFTIVGCKNTRLATNKIYMQWKHVFSLLQNGAEHVFRVRSNLCCFGFISSPWLSAAQWAIAYCLRDNMTFSIDCAAPLDSSSGALPSTVSPKEILAIR